MEKFKEKSKLNLRNKYNRKNMIELNECFKRKQQQHVSFKG